MAPHKFAAGQQVVFLPGPADGNVPRGLFTIVRPLPGDDFDRTYRVRSILDNHERIVREKQLRPGSHAAPG